MFSKYANELKALTGVDIMADEATGEFKDLYEIFGSISEVWGDLSDTQQSRVSEILGGTRQLQVISSILNNWDDAANAYEDAMNSAGVATEAQAVYMQSLQAQIDQFKASVQELYYDFLSSDLVSAVVKFGTAVINVLDNIIDSIGSVATAMAGIGIAKIISDISKGFKEFSKSGQWAFGTSFSNIFKSLQEGLYGFQSAFDAGGGIFASLNAGLSATMSNLTAFNALFIGVAAGIAAYNIGKNIFENWVQSAKDTAEAWAGSSEEINEYKDQITELRDALDSGTLSEEEAYETKSELLSIQESLTDSYGAQVDGIDLVNGSLEEQLALLDSINSAEAKAALKDMKSQYKSATKEIEGFNTLITNNLPQEYYNDFQKMISGYEDYFTFQDNGNAGYTILFTGNAEDAEKVLGDLKVQIASLGDDALDKVYEDVDNALSYAQDILEQWQDVYDTGMEMTVAADENTYATSEMAKEEGKSAAEWLRDYSEAVYDYNDALASGDSKAIEKARDAYEEINGQVNELVENTKFSQYGHYIDEISTNLDEGAISANAFKDSLLSDDTAMGEYAARLKELNMTESEFKNTVISVQSEGVTTWWLTDMAFEAERAGISLDELADILADIGVLFVSTSKGAEKVTFSSLLVDEEGADTEFKSAIDNIKSDIDDLNGVLDDWRNGEEIDLSDLIINYDVSGDLETLSQELTEYNVKQVRDWAVAYNDAVSALEEGSVEAEKASRVLDTTLYSIDLSYYTDQYSELMEYYDEEMAEASKLGVDLSNTVFGNIDLNNRQVLEWTEENLEEFEDAIESWGETIETMEGYSTVFGSDMSFDIEGSEVEIAFSPILQTDDGPVLLSTETVSDYIGRLLDKLPDEWTYEDLFELDFYGLDVDGQHIQGLLAAIGEESEYAAEAMHFIGTDGSIESARKQLEGLEKELKNLAISNAVANIDEAAIGAYESEAIALMYEERLGELFDMYSGDIYGMEAIVQLSLDTSFLEASLDDQIDWIENDAKIYIELDANVDELEDLQKEMEKLEDEQSLLESSQSLSEAMGIKKTTRDYKDLINNSKKQTKNIQEQNKNLEAQRDLYSALGRDTSELDSQIVSNTNSLRGALEQQIEWNNAALALTYNQALEGIDTLRSAMSEAVSDTRLSGDTIKSIMDTFSGVEGYNAQELFVQTSSGVELNVESLKNLEDEYVKLEKSNYASQLADLGKQYQDSQDYIDSLGDAVKELTQEEQDMILEAAGYRGITGLENDITYLDLLMTSLDGATSKYQTWVNATSATNPSAAFESMGDYYETAGDLIERGWYDNEGLNAYLDLMLSADRRTGDVVEDYKKLSEAIEGTGGHSLKDYWTTDASGNLTSLGAYQFADDLIAIMGEEYGTWSEENGYQFTQWGDEQIQAIADTFGTSTDYIRAMIDAMDEAGFTVKTYEDYVNDALVALEEFNEENQEISLSTDFDFEISEMSLDEINDTIESLESDRVVIEAKIEDETDDDVIAGLQEQLDNLDLSIEALNQQKIELNIQSEIDEGNLQELDRLIEAGEHEEVAMRLGIEYDVDNEEAMAQLDAYELYLQSIAQQDRVETAIEVALEGEETVDSLLEAYDNEELDVVLGIEGEEEIDAAYQKLQQMQEESATYDVTVRIDEEQFEQLTTPDVDVDANTKPAQTAVDELITEINEMEATITVNTQTAGSEESTTTTQYDASETITTSGVVEFSADYKEVEDSEAPSKDGIVGYSVEDDDVQGYAAPEKTGIASYIVDSSRIDSWRAPSKVGIVIYTADTHLLPTTFSDLHRKVIYEAEGDTNGSLATGTATSVPSIPHAHGVASIPYVHAAGTAYSSWTNYQHSIGAYAGGTWQDWSIPHDETALTNEVGQESIVRSGKWMLIPGGAHFEDLKRGDIVNKTRIYLVTGI